MTVQHKKLASGKWYELRLVEQLANVGSEVIRAINRKNKGNEEYSKLAFYRALELMDLTLSDPKNKKRYSEIARTREVLVDYLFGENIYSSTGTNLEKYFMEFNYVARN